MPLQLRPNLGWNVSKSYVCLSCLFGASIAGQDVPLQAPRSRRCSNESGKERGAISKSQRTLRVADRIGRLSTGTPQSRIRQYATSVSLASSTAINSPSSVPSQLRELHQSLLALERVAASFVDLSRLQLAVRSLESDLPVVRVAYLGLGSDGALAARKLARVLLADPLGQEEEWEKALVDKVGSEKSLLLKWGETAQLLDAAPLVDTMRIPSAFLRQNRLEILITTFHAARLTATQIDHSSTESSIHVPPLTMPNSVGGRVGFVRYPVHRSLIIAQGVTGAIEFGRLPISMVDDELVSFALVVPSHSSSVVESSEGKASGHAVDVDLAAHTLRLFRSDRAKGTQFSQEWQTSRLSAISEWLSRSARGREDGLRDAIRSYTASVLKSISQAIERTEHEAQELATRSTVPSAKRENMQSAISTWSESAHHDLQTNLDSALASRTWHRMAWWRLFWRIDDISVSAEDVLRTSWLNEAQQNLAFLSGQIHEAGLATIDELKQIDARQLLSDAAHSVERQEALENTPQRAQIMQFADLLQTRALLSRVQQQSGIQATFDPPWPQTIHFAQQQMLHTLVPSMHVKAQSLLLSTMTTIGSSAVLGAWLYIASGGFAFYEAGAIAAFGLGWGLRRIQRLWGREREKFATTLRETGRTVLAEIERHLRRAVTGGGRAEVSKDDANGWKEAKAAVQRCRDELEKIT